MGADVLNNAMYAASSHPLTPSMTPPLHAAATPERQRASSIRPSPGPCRYLGQADAHGGLQAADVTQCVEQGRTQVRFDVIITLP